VNRRPRQEDQVEIGIDFTGFMKLAVGVSFVVGLLMLTGDQSMWPGAIILAASLIAGAVLARWP